MVHVKKSQSYSPPPLIKSFDHTDLEVLTFMKMANLITRIEQNSTLCNICSSI